MISAIKGNGMDSRLRRPPIGHDSVFTVQMDARRFRPVVSGLGLEHEERLTLGHLPARWTRRVLLRHAPQRLQSALRQSVLLDGGDWVWVL